MLTFCICSFLGQRKPSVGAFARSLAGTLTAFVNFVLIIIFKRSEISVLVVSTSICDRI